MATCSVSLKFSEKPGRIHLEGVQLTNDVQWLKKLVAPKISLAESQFDLIYCGRCLRDENTLQSYGVKPGATLHALRKKDTETGIEAEPMNEAAIQQLLTALQSALIDPSQRQTVIRILTSREMLDNVIAATPSLQGDPPALAMLQDPELLIQLADPNMIHNIVKAHPALGEAALHLAAAVNEESTTRGSLFGGYPDEDMEIAESTPGSSQAANRQQQPITSAQLTAALAAAGVGTSQGGGGGSGQPPSASSQASAGSGTSQSTITADLFNQAIAQALSASASSAAAAPPMAAAPSMAPTGSTATPENLQSQLQQLREMGITDEARCLQALQVTDGNVQAALELLFDGRI